MNEIFDDIRKLYKFKLPCEELSEYIEFFSETSLEAMHRHIGTEKFTVRLFASYTPTIWLNLGSPYYLKNGDKTHFISEDTDILLLRNEIVERTNLPTDNIFTVKFNPGGFEAIFGIQQARIGSDLILLSDLLPSGLIRKVKRLDDFSGRMELLQRHFLDLLNKDFAKNYAYRKVSAAIHAYTRSEMENKNHALAHEMAMTDKTFYRYFKALIGVPPKGYFSIIRARTALTAYVKDKENFSPFEYGYYDPSHFHKDVIKFTGQKLSAFEKE